MAAGNVELALRIKSDLGNAVSDVDRLTKAIGRQGAAAKQADRDSHAFTSSINKMKAAIAGYLSVQTAINAGASFLRANAEAGKLKASLETVTGSAKRAAEAWAQLETFAKRTPFELEQSVRAFIRLSNLGLDPSERAMRAYGDFASAMGRDLMDMVEAVGDAIMGQNRRLEEMGVGVDATGQKIRYTVKGVVYEVEKSAKAIEQFLIRISEQEFGGGMERQMKSIGGAMANLADQIGAFWRAAGDAGNASRAVGVINWLERAVDGLTNAIRNANAVGFIGPNGITSVGVPPPSSGGMEDWLKAKQEEERAQAKAVAAGVKQAITTRAEMEALLLDIEKRRDLPVGSLIGLWGTESSYGLDPKRQSPAGALGPMQFMPETAKRFGLDINSTDLREHAEAAGRYMEFLFKQFGDLALAYAGYNAGENAVMKYQGIPPYEETQGHVAKSLRLRSEYLAGAGIPNKERWKAAQDAAKESAKAIEDNARAAAEADELLAKLNEDLVSQAEAWRDTIDPMREHIRALDELTALYRAGQISPDVYQAGQGIIAKRMKGTAEEMAKDAEKPFAQMEEMATQAARNIHDAFAEFLYRPWEDGLRGMLESFADMLHRMAAEILAQQAMLAILKMLGGAAGGTNWASQAMAALVRHDGGDVAPGGRTRTVPAYLMQFAPRLHGGLAPDEYPAILQTGEQVLSRSQVAAGQGQASGGNVRIVNTVDPALFSDWLQGASGERVIMNVIRRNRLQMSVQ